MDVRVLGTIEIIGPADEGGSRLGARDLPRRVRQVLGVLAARHDRVQSKDALADAVWGEDLPGNHAAALEHYVSALRRAVQPGLPPARSFIVTRAGGYTFATDRARLDLAELRAAARVAESEPGRADVREQIVRLARDLPFAEDEDAAWAAPARAEVRAALVGALLDLAERAVDTDAGRALGLGRRALELEPYAERGYRVLMRAAAGQGRTDEVLRWYEQCVRAFTGELGIAPAPATTELRDALTGPPTGPVTVERRRGDRRKAARPNLTMVRDIPQHAATVVALPAPAGFAGRAAELDALAHGPAVVHVAGPAGAGKTALLGRLRELHPRVVGLGRGPGPGGALRLGWLRTILHQLGVPADDMLDAAMAARRHLLPGELDDLSARLRDRAAPERPVVAIDDTEHLDADSVAELRWLQERGARIVVSYRYPSAIAERPLGALEADLVLRPAPLGAHDLPPDVLDASGGIPGLIAPARELGPELAAEAAMHLARQRTRWMPPAAWEILRLTAALGSLRVEQAAAAGGLELDDVLGAVDQLVHAHLLVEGPGGHVRHRSSLVRAAVAAQVSAARSQHLRARLA